MQDFCLCVHPHAPAPRQAPVPPAPPPCSASHSADEGPLLVGTPSPGAWRGMFEQQLVCLQAVAVFGSTNSYLFTKSVSQRPCGAMEGGSRGSAWAICTADIVHSPANISQGLGQASPSSEAGQGSSSHQVIPETLTRTGVCAYREAIQFLLLGWEQPTPSTEETTMHPPCAGVLGSAVWTGPGGDSVSLPWDVWSLGHWPWQLGLPAQEAW